MQVRLLAMLAITTLLAGPVTSADETKPAKLTHMVALADDLKWVDAPPGLPPGGKMAVLDGDPSKEGSVFTLRAKLPDGYIVPPHFHGTDESITVLEGSFGIAVGEKFDKSKIRYLPPGSFARMSKGEKHYVQTKGATVIQITAVGPFDISYVDPSDDPRKK